MHRCKFVLSVWFAVRRWLRSKRMSSSSAWRAHGGGSTRHARWWGRAGQGRAGQGRAGWGGSVPAPAAAPCRAAPASHAWREAAAPAPAPPGRALVVGPRAPRVQGRGRRGARVCGALHLHAPPQILVQGAQLPERGGLAVSRERAGGSGQMREATCASCVSCSETDLRKRATSCSELSSACAQDSARAGRGGARGGRPRGGARPPLRPRQERAQVQAQRRALAAGRSPVGDARPALRSACACGCSAPGRAPVRARPCPVPIARRASAAARRRRPLVSRPLRRGARAATTGTGRGAVGRGRARSGASRRGRGRHCVDVALRLDAVAPALLEQVTIAAGRVGHGQGQGRGNDRREAVRICRV